MTKSKIINGALWLALLLTMAASIQHLAWVFGTVEQPGREWLGWIPAVAVDAGLAALAYTIQQRKRAKRPTAILWVGVAGFALISALANLYHALAVEGVVLATTWALYAKAFILSATLPAMYVFLGEIISGDDATAAEREAKQAEREQAKAEREQARADREARTRELEAERLLLEAQRAQEQPAAAAETSETQSVTCANCGRSFRSINARNAHKCEGKPQNGTIHITNEALELIRSQRE